MGRINPNEAEADRSEHYEIEELFPQTLEVKREKRESLAHEIKPEDPTNGPPLTISREGLSDVAL